MAKKVIGSVFKSSVFRMIAALTVVGVFSGAVLVFVYNYAMPKIRVNVNAETERAIQNIFPESVRIKSTQEKEIFRVMDKNNKLLGYAFIAEGNGYQGIIKLIIGVDTDISEMKGMEVLESQETPGLGAEIASDSFREQFKGLPLIRKIEYVKNKKPQEPYQIEAITGATISSRAVVNIINKRIDSVRQKLKGGSK